MPTIYSDYSSIVALTMPSDFARPSPKPHLYFHVPSTVFRARVNMPGTTIYPVTALIFDGVTTGAYTDIHAGMTVLLGTAAGLDDLGRVRMQNIATATTLPVGRVSQGVEDGTLYVQDNAYITVWDDYRVWSKLPYVAVDPDPDAIIDEDGLNYKDSDILVGDYMTQIPPVANCGPGFADYIDPITEVITVTFDGSLSYAMADGATITDFLWNVEDGAVIAGDLDEVTLTVTFPAGFRYVGLSVIDSNTKGHTAACPVLAVDPANDVTVENSKCQITQRLTQNGQTLDVNMAANMPRTSWPDGCLAMLWWDAPSSPSDRSHMEFIGWLQSESFVIRATRTGLVKETVLHCVDVAGRLATLPGFPQALERRSDEQHWSYMPTLDINKALHYLLHWHSTALTVADFFLPALGDDYPAMRIDTAGATLYDQVNSTSIKIDPDHILTCNAKGQLSVIADWMLMDVGDRPTAAPILTEDDYSELSMDYHRPPRVHVLRNSAVVSSTTWLVIGGEDTLPIVFSIAPGDAFSQGTSEQTEAEGLTLSQALLNKTTGHKYARANARFGQARIKLPSSNIWDYEPALMQRIQLNIAAEYAAQRGLPFTQVNVMVKELSVRYVTDKTGTRIEAELVVEFETSGYPGQTVIPPESETPDYETPEPELPTTPPDMGLVEGVEEVAGLSLDGFVYRTADFQNATPTWDEVDLGIGAIYSFVVDPFSPGYITGSGTIDGWVVGETDIYRVTDLFGTPNATSVLAFAVANDMSLFHWRTIQASFGAYFEVGSNPWLLCVSYYGDTSGHEGTWATYSMDGGVTWATEVEVSAEYAADAPTRHNPIGVYASPKTPGLAYTAAHAGDVDATAPVWGIEPTGAGGNPPSILGYGGAFSFTLLAEQDSTIPGTITTKTPTFHVAPPADTVRMEITVDWFAQRTVLDPGSGSGATTMDYDEQATVAHDIASTFNWANPGAPPVNTTTTSSGSYTATYTRDATHNATWESNRDDMLAGVTDSDEFVGWSFDAQASATGDCSALVRHVIRFTVTEIELEDATIYTPAAGGSLAFVSADYGATWTAEEAWSVGDGQAGSIHIPWPTNPAETIIYHGNMLLAPVRQYRLYRSDAGVATDISPTDSGVSYGVQTYEFGIRTHDSNRQYALVGAIGNDTSADAADDMHAVFISIDGGDSWTLIEGPTADSAAPAGRPIYHAAFGGNSEQIVFLWGAENYITYSDDFGGTLGDKSGNLSSFGSVYFTGIAGGPTG